MECAYCGMRLVKGDFIVTVIELHLLDPKTEYVECLDHEAYLHKSCFHRVMQNAISNPPHHISCHASDRQQTMRSDVQPDVDEQVTRTDVLSVFGDHNEQ